MKWGVSNEAGSLKDRNRQGQCRLHVWAKWARAQGLYQLGGPTPTLEYNTKKY